MKKTPLHAEHLKLGAKMGEFAGYDMPLYYGLGVMKEHEWTRENAGLFDVSHMGQAMVRGAGALEFVEKITPSSFSNLAVPRAKYTVLTNPEGGIIDDLIVTHADDDAFHFVLNAGRKGEDITWIKKHLPDDLTFIHFEDWALIALQGPKAETVVRETLNIDLSDMPYMSMRAFNDNSLFISRLGYTGEDGFEIAVKNEEAAEMWNTLLNHKAVEPIGLAARDSLRLDMGYPLYGHDIDETTSPVEADLNWIISKNTSGFIGEDRIRKEQEQGTVRKRVGIKLTGKGIAREGAELRDKNDNLIGTLTSGGFSPTLKSAIGMGYIVPDMAKTGTEIFVNVRGRNIEAVIADMPFVPANTKSMKKTGNTTAQKTQSAA